MMQKILILLGLAVSSAAQAQTVYTWPTNSAAGKTTAVSCFGSSDSAICTWAGGSVTGTVAQAQEAVAGWTAAGDSAPAPVSTAPTLTPAQQAAALIQSCTITLTSTSTAALNAVYPCDPTTTAKIAAMASMAASGVLPSGQTGYPMRDAAGVWHTMTAAQYQASAAVIASYVAAVQLIADGGPGALPTAVGAIP